MARHDNDPKIRDMARILWEKAGRPNGREHEYWALASWSIDYENDNASRPARSAAS